MLYAHNVPIVFMYIHNSAVDMLTPFWRSIEQVYSLVHLSVPGCMAISPSWEVRTFLITYITIYPLLVLQYLSEQSNDFSSCSFRLDLWTYGHA